MTGDETPIDHHNCSVPEMPMMATKGVNGTNAGHNRLGKEDLRKLLVEHEGSAAAEGMRNVAFQLMFLETVSPPSAAKVSPAVRYSMP
jgi:hypothetical protein